MVIKGSLCASEKWGSYPNLGRLPQELRQSWPSLLGDRVTVTQKLDGSNLAFRVRNGELNAVQGRRHEIWNVGLNTEAELQELKYGPTKRLGSLACRATEFGVLVGSKLKLSELIVFGEIMPAPDGEHFWYPFGVKFPRDPQDRQDPQDPRDPPATAGATGWFNGAKGIYEDDKGPQASTSTPLRWSKLMLGDKLHAVFEKCSEKIPRIAPPPVLFQHGTLAEAMSALKPAMLKGEAKFEGVFIVCLTAGWAAKWKTGAFEEQPRLHECGFADDPSWQILKAVYATKQNRPRDTNATKVSHVRKRADPVRPLVLAALQHELTKRAPPVVLTDELVALVVQEAHSRTESVPKATLVRATPGILRGYFRSLQKGK